MNGYVTVISMETGKCLDVEVLSKVCQGCQRHETKEDSQEKRLWQADHQGKCKANYKGSAPAMEVEGVKHIFERSIFQEERFLLLSAFVLYIMWMEPLVLHFKEG